MHENHVGAQIRREKNVRHLINFTFALSVCVCVPFRHFERSAHGNRSKLYYTRRRQTTKTILLLCAFTYHCWSIHSINDFFFMPIILFGFVLRGLCMLISADRSLFSEFCCMTFIGFLTTSCCFVCVCCAAALLWFIQIQSIGVFFFVLLNIFFLNTKRNSNDGFIFVMQNIKTVEHLSIFQSIFSQINVYLFQN